MPANEKKSCLVSAESTNLVFFFFLLWFAASFPFPLKVNVYSGHAL